MLQAILRMGETVLTTIGAFGNFMMSPLWKTNAFLPDWVVQFWESYVIPTIQNGQYANNPLIKAALWFFNLTPQDMLLSMTTLVVILIIGIVRWVLDIWP